MHIGVSFHFISDFNKIRICVYRFVISNMNIYSLLILECCIWTTATVCTPSITKGSYSKQELGGHIYLKCDISSCSRVSRIIFEKNSVHQPDHWTPVFEGINESNYTALDTSDDYSLKQRSIYIAFPTYHTLYINPLTTEDIALWRCAAYLDKRRIVSKATHIAPAKLTYPKKELLITSNGSSPVVITCSGSGYRPHITWQRNGIDIQSDNRRHISTDGNASNCTGTLTLKQLDRPLTCKKVDDFAGDYACTVSLEPPHTSNETSSPIRVKILHKPLPKKQPERVVISESKTATLRCEVCSTTAVTSAWTLNGEILKGHNVELQPDGSLILTGHHPSGEYSRSVKNSFGSFNCIVHVVNTDSSTYLWIIYSVLSVLGFLLAMIALWLVQRRLKCISKLRRRLGRQPRNEEGYQMVTVLDTQFPDSPKMASFAQTIPLTEETWSIWRSPHQDCVFVGGHSTPSITTINFGSTPIRYILPTGTSIVNGHSIDPKTHVINVYDETLKKHFIYCVDIETIFTDGQKTINPHLELSAKIKRPGCIFAIDTSSVGIYCTIKRMIDVFSISNIKKPAHVENIKLTKYDANENDSLCANLHGHICVLSYKHGIVYIYNRRGDLVYTFSTGMLIDPLQIQWFSDNSLAVVNMHGEIRRFNENSESEIIKLDESNHFLQAAVFTKSLLWVIDATDSTKIHVFKTNATKQDN